jgi:hypothetical protein
MSRYSAVDRCITPILQELSTYSARVNCIVVDHTANLVRALDPNKFTETAQFLSLEQVLQMEATLRRMRNLKTVVEKKPPFSHFRMN